MPFFSLDRIEFKADFRLNILKATFKSSLSWRKLLTTYANCYKKCFFISCISII